VKELLLFVSVIAIGLAACGDPYQEKMPSDPADKGAMLSLIRYLKPDEQKLLLAYQERIAMQKASGGGGYPAGMTVRQAIDEQRRWAKEEGERLERERAEARRKTEEEQRRKKEQADKALKQMLEVCSVEMVKKKVVKKGKGAMSFEAFDIDLRFHNKGNKDLRLIIGSIEIRDEKGKLLKQMKIPYRKRLKAGQTATFGGKSRYDPSKGKDVALANTPLGKLQVKWIPKVYKFEDGTRLGTEPEPEKLRRRL